MGVQGTLGVLTWELVEEDILLYPHLFSIAAHMCLSLGSVPWRTREPGGWAEGRGEQAAQKQVFEGRVARGQMLAFGAGRWSWALVWATVSGEDRAQGWGRARENEQEGRGERVGREWPRLMAEPGLWGESRIGGCLEWQGQAGPVGERRGGVREGTALVED